MALPEINSADGLCRYRYTAEKFCSGARAVEFTLGGMAVLLAISSGDYVPGLLSAIIAAGGIGLTNFLEDRANLKIHRSILDHALNGQFTLDESLSPGD